MPHPIDSFCFEHVEDYLLHHSTNLDNLGYFLASKRNKLLDITRLIYTTFEEVLEQLRLGQDFAVLNHLDIASVAEEDMFFEELKAFARIYYEYHIVEMEHTAENQRYYVEGLNRTFGFEALSPHTTISARTYFVSTPAQGSRSNQYIILPHDKMRAYRENVMTRLPIFEGKRHE